MKQTVWLVRHPPVTLAWQRRCYGRSDPGFSREGARMAKALALKIAAWSPDLAIHSDVRRTRSLAERVGAPLLADPQWRERHFGNWEGQSWQAIYRATGSAMDKMLSEPDSFRPGGGETTAELFERIRHAWHTLPPLPRIAIVTHGGPIACARAQHEGASFDRLPAFIPAAGEIVTLQF